MKNSVKKFISEYKKTGFILGILLCLYFLTRLINLTIIPIFTDEAIYLRWAQIALGDASWRLISLTDGKQPLFIWFTMIAMKYIEDPLVAGRLVSVLSGAGGMVGMFFLASKISGKQRIGYIASFLYIISPFFLVYDRLALMDGLLAAIGIWSFYLSLILVKRVRLDVALILGMLIGVGLLTKSSANFFILFLPVSLILFDFKNKQWKTNLQKWIGCVVCIVVISQAMYTILRLSPFFHMIGQKDHNFILTLGEFLHNPFIYARGNMQGLLTWLGEYLTWPVFVLTIISSLYLLKKNIKVAGVLLLWFLVPFLALSFFGKILYPRYLLFMIISLPVLLSFFIADMVALKGKIWVKALIILCFIPTLWFDILLLTVPVNAPLPLADKSQLLTYWPSGYGVQNVIKFARDKAKNGKVFLATEGTFGLFPAAFELYLNTEKNITMRGYWPVNEVPPELLKEAETKDTYLVFKELQEIPKNWPLKLVMEIQRGNGDTYLRMYQVVNVK